ncbi:MAG: hypothetical protein AAB656_00100 [Patescibacteria group bacterium]
MSTEIPGLYNEIDKEFRSALSQAAEDEYVQKPKALATLSKRRRQFIEMSKANNQIARENLARDSRKLVDQYGISMLSAKDLILRAWDTESRLAEEGVIFGDTPFNFSLDRPTLTSDEAKQVAQISQTTMEAMAFLAQRNLDSDLGDSLPLNPVEQAFENLRLAPNAARLDFILTDNGPKLIEANLQWVDAIAAIEGFQKVYGKNKPSPTEELAKTFPPGTRLAIINVNQNLDGSRSKGPAAELEMLATKLAMYENIKVCEVIDPDKTRIEYLEEFNRFYINCDPRTFKYVFPDWIETVVKRVKQNGEAMFPAWRPRLDKKMFLATLCSPALGLRTDMESSGVDLNTLRNGICATRSLAGYVQDPEMQKIKKRLEEFTEQSLSTLGALQMISKDSPFIIKGDGYSLNSVALSNSPNFKDFRPAPNTTAYSYVIQPVLDGKRMDAWVFETSRKRVKFLKNAYTKLNVWYINGKVVGMLSTLSDSPLISDKGYNAVPIIK